MITPSMVYFIGILDNVLCFFEITLFILVLFACAIAITIFHIDEPTWTKKALKYILCIAFVAFLFGCLRIFIPSSKTAAAMYIIPAIANNEKVQTIGENSIEILRKLSKQWLLELDKDKK